MPVLQPVIATLIANTQPAMAKMTEFVGFMDGVSAQVDAAGMRGAQRLAWNAEKSATEAAAATKAQSAVLGESIIGDFVNNLTAVDTAAKKSAKTIVDDFFAAFKSAPFQGLQGIFQAFGGQIPNSIGRLMGLGDAMSSVAGEAGIMGATIGGVSLPIAAAGAAAVAAGADAIAMSVQYEKATNQIAAQEGITTDAAKKIGEAFLTTAGSSTYTANQMAQAFAPVAGSLRTLNKGALDATKSLTFMEAAANLAEGSGGSLNSTTSALAKTLTTYGISVDQSAAASDALFTASTQTGLGLSGVASMLQRLKTQLGANAPSLQDTAALMIDLNNNAITGRGAISAVSVLFKTLITPSTQAADAMAKYGIKTKDAYGNLLPLGKIIEQLRGHIAGMGNAQAAATLKSMGFGYAATKLVGVIQDGGKAFDKSRDAVLKHNAAVDAASKSTEGIGGSFHKMTSGFQDLMTEIGNIFMPILKDLGKILLDVGNAIIKGVVFAFKALKPVLEATMLPLKAVIWVVKELIRWYVKLQDTVFGWVGSLLGLHDAHAAATDAANKHGEALNKLHGSEAKAAEEAKKHETVVKTQAAMIGMNASLLQQVADKTGKSTDSISKNLEALSKKAGVTADSIAKLGLASGQSFQQIADGITKAQGDAQNAFDKSYGFVEAFKGATDVTGDQITKFFTDSKTNAIAFAVNLRQAITDGFDPKLISDILTAGPKDAGGILQSVVQNFTPEMGSVIKQSEDMLRTLSSDAAVMAKLTYEATTGDSINMAKDLPTAMAIYQQQMAQGTDATLQSIAAAMGQKVRDIRPIADEYGLAIPDAINSPQSKNLTVSAIDNLGNVIKIHLKSGNKTKELQDAAKALGVTITGDMAKGILDGRPKVVNTANEFLKLALDETAKAGNHHAKQIGSKIASGIYDATKTGLDEAKPKVTKDSQALGQSMGDGVTKGIHTAAAGVSTALSRSAINAISNTKTSIGAKSPSTKTQNDLGIPMMDGIILGITTKQGELSQALITACDQAVKNAKKHLDSKSPSKVTHDQLGVPIIQGITMGVLSQREELAKAVESTVGEAVARGRRASNTRIGIDVMGRTRAMTDFAAATTASIGAPLAAPTGQQPVVIQITTPMTVDGHTLARMVTQYQLKGARATGNVLGQWSGGSQTAQATSINVNAISR